MVLALALSVPINSALATLEVKFWESISGLCTGRLKVSRGGDVSPSYGTNGSKHFLGPLLSAKYKILNENTKYYYI